MSVVIYEKKDAVVNLTFNRPEALNALNEDVLKILNSHLLDIEKDTSVQVVCLRGAGEKAFVAGADIKAMSNLSQEEAKQLSQLGHDVGHTLERMPQISIACVDGFALGGGCEMAMACDLIYASEKAKFGQPEVNLGVIPGFGGTQRLPRAIGIVKAKELLFTGKLIGAEEAKQLGLVCDVFPADKFDEEVEKVVSVLLQKGPSALVQTKRAVDQGFSLSVNQGCELEKNMFSQCFAQNEQKEGMDAFLNKRKANFKK